METYADRPEKRRPRRRLSLTLVAVLAATASVLVARDLAAPAAPGTAVAIDTYRPAPVGPRHPSAPVVSTTVTVPATTAPPTTIATVPATAHAAPADPAGPPATTAPAAGPAATAPPTPATTAPPPPTTAAPAPAVAAAATAPAGYGCAAALAYLQAHAAPGFTFECPGNALGHQAMTCSFVAGVCPGTRIIAIADPCPAAYMNEAYNSRVAEGLASGPFDPYGYCRN